MIDFENWWNSEAADEFRAKHDGEDGEVFRPIWNAAAATLAIAPALEAPAAPVRQVLTDGQITDALWRTHLRWMEQCGIDTEGMRPTGTWLEHWLIYARAIESAALAAAPQAPAAPASFQQRVKPWLLACFGAEIACDQRERNHRFLEEALELVQSRGCTASEAHQLVDYVYARPIGEPSQEVGGVMVTLAALCYANGLDMHAAGERELERISVPAMMAKIKAKQAAKPKHSPLPAAPARAHEDAREGLTQAALEEYEAFFSEAFAQACSNGLFDAWGKNIDCTRLNEAHHLASQARAARAAQGGAA